MTFFDRWKRGAYTFFDYEKRGARYFFHRRKKGATTFFSKWKRGAATFFHNPNLGGQYFFTDNFWGGSNFFWEKRDGLILFSPISPFPHFGNYVINLIFDWLTRSARFCSNSLHHEISLLAEPFWNHFSWLGNGSSMGVLVSSWVGLRNPCMVGPKII